MTQILMRRLLLGAIVVLCGHLSSGAIDSAKAQDGSNANMTYGPPGNLDLFYNYYGPTSGGGAPAALYLAPRPVPANVGHVYYTYQALLPHEYLYPHHREYFTYFGHYHGNSSVRGHQSINHTTVRYQRGACMRPLYIRRFHRPQVPKIPGGHCATGYGCQ